MAEEQFVSVERRDDGVAVLRLDRPKVNALSKALLAQLRDAADDLTADLMAALDAAAEVGGLRVEQRTDVTIG